MSPNEQRLKEQRDLLWRCLGLCLSVFTDREITADLEREHGEDRNEWREFRHMIVSDDEGSKALRQQWAKSAFYGHQLELVRTMLKRRAG